MRRPRRRHVIADRASARLQCVGSMMPACSHAQQAVSQSIKDAKGSMTIPSPRLDVGQLENEPFVFSKEPHYLAGKRSLAMARTPAENKRSTCGIVQSILTPNQDNPALTFTSMANVTTQRLLSLNKRGFGRKFDPDLKLNAKPRSY